MLKVTFEIQKYFQKQSATLRPALTDYSWWTDRNNQSISYWHGDEDKDAVGCQCFFNGNSCENNYSGIKVLYNQSGHGLFEFFLIDL